MATISSSSSSSLTLASSSSTLLDCKAALRPSAIGVSLPPPTHQPQTRSLSKATTYCRKIARNVVSMATGEVPAAEVAEFETPEIVKTVQEYWDKLEDKYAVSSLVVAAGVGLVASAGVVAAIDKLPLIPGVLELVGIGYTGYFAYKNLIFKPERDALIQKVKETYKEIIGSS